MFKTTRPRVPSKPTLRILYQLAYISSGTAVGAATLCAEERRRRTQAVQKIADNARRIRQSPRHVHNATAAVAVDSNGDGHLEDWELEDLQKKARRSKRKKKEEVEWSARAADLPSKVETGYAHLLERDRRQSVKRKSRVAATREPRLDNGRALGHTALDDVGVGASAKRNRAFRLFSYSSQMDLRNDAQMMRAATALGGREVSSVDIAVRENRHKDRLSILRPVENITLNEDDTYKGDMPSANSTSANLQARGWPIRNYGESSNPATVSRDVEMFLRHPSLLSHTIEVPREHAARLWHRVLDYGSFSEVRSLYLWMLKVHALKDHDICGLSEACRGLALRSDHEELLDFYQELFATPRFAEMPGELKAYCLLTVSAEIVWWDISQDQRIDFQFRHVSSHGNLTEVMHALRRVCDKLLQDERPGDAIALTLPMERYIGERAGMVPLSYLRQIEVKIFTSAVETGQLWHCSRIINLRSLSGDTKDERLLRLVQPLLEKAYQSKQYGPVTSLLTSPSTRSFLQRVCDQFNTEERTCLAIACTKTNHGSEHLWRMLYQSTPECHRNVIVKARTIEKLRETWKATHNLDLVHTLYEEVLSWSETNRPEDHYLKAAIGLTMVEILNSAKKPERALRLIQRISMNHAHSSLSLSMTALTLAAKGLWEEVAQLVDVLGRWGKFTVDESVSRTLNKLLQSFSAQHNARETWGFVTRLMAKLGFKPALATKETMLQCFVAKQALHMIPEWLRLLKAMGRPLTLNTDVAVRLLIHYYHEHRPSHVLVFWFSRALTENASSLQPAKLMDLLKDSVGHDIRKTRAGLRLKAKQNLALLEKAGGGIPAPVNSVMEARQLAAQQNTAKDMQSNLELKPRVSYAPPGCRACQSDVAATSANFSSEDDAFIPSTSLTERSQRASQRSAFEEMALPFVRVASRSRELGTRQDYQGSSIVDPEQHVDDMLANWNASEEDSVDSTTSLNTIHFPLEAMDEWDLKTEIPKIYRTYVAKESTHTPRSGRVSRQSNPVPSDDSGQQGTVSKAPTTMHDNSFLMPGVVGESTSPNSPINTTEEMHRTAADQHQYGMIKDSEGFDKKQLERDMIQALSLQRYQEVLKLYSRNLTSSGLPSSRLVLQVAVEASLRLRKGDCDEAEQIMTKAREAGMDVTAAAGHLLMQRIWHFNPLEKRDFNKLRMTVIEYYRMNAESGLRVSHLVGNTAANILINNHRPQHGLNLLNSIYKSTWVRDRRLTIAAMTIYLKGYAAIGSRSGIEWVVLTVLKENMRIDTRFLETLKSSPSKFGSGRTWASGVTDTDRADFSACIRYWHSACTKRRNEQRLQSKAFGWQLVEVLRLCAEAASKTKLDSSFRKEAEDAILGKAEYKIPRDATTEELEAQQKATWHAGVAMADADVRKQAIRRLRSVLYIPQHEKLMDQDARQIDDPDWLNKYRVILQQALIIDGWRASFRYKLDIDMGCPNYAGEELPFEQIVAEAQAETADGR